LKLTFHLLDDFILEKKMGFQCPQCSHLKSLRITSSIELAPDAPSDEISLQVLCCRDCDYEGPAVYEESSRGGFDSESVDHHGYHANRETIRSVSRMVHISSNWWIISSLSDN
jgi:C4-type Zn-finger protein